MHQSYTTINHILRQAYYTKNDSCALKIVLKEIMETQHKSKRLTLRRGKQGLTCARAFHFYKDRSKIILRGVCCCQRMVMGTLTTSPTGLSRAAPMNYCIFIWHSFQPFFHKPWLTESSGACQQSHTMKECLFILVLL
jgi:hypothetical protein